MRRASSRASSLAAERRPGFCSSTYHGGGKQRGSVMGGELKLGRAALVRYSAPGKGRPPARFRRIHGPFRPRCLSDRRSSGKMAKNVCVFKNVSGTGVKRTSLQVASMSAFDTKRTLKRSATTVANYTIFSGHRPIN